MADTSPCVQIMQKTGQIERTIDREYVEQEAMYKACVRRPSLPSAVRLHYASRYEKECQTLQKESKAYIDAMRRTFCPTPTLSAARP
jgi:hypothetical protein